jgi:hypothetical protein
MSYVNLSAMASLIHVVRPCSNDVPVESALAGIEIDGNQVLLDALGASAPVEASLHGPYRLHEGQFQLQLDLT